MGSCLHRQMTIAANHEKLLIACSDHVPVFSQVPPSLVCSSKPHSWQCGKTISQYQLEMWWMTGGRRGNRAPQNLSASLPLPISLPFSLVLGQPPWSHTHLNFLVSDESLTFQLQDRSTRFFYRRGRGRHGSSPSVFIHSDGPLCSALACSLSYRA